MQPQQDNVSLHSGRAPIRNGPRSKSVPQISNGGLVKYGPPIQRSYTAGPRANNERRPFHNIHEGKMSYFVVKENEPTFTSHPARGQSLFIADR